MVVELVRDKLLGLSVKHGQSAAVWIDDPENTKAVLVKKHFSGLAERHMDSHSARIPVEGVQTGCSSNPERSFPVLRRGQNVITTQAPGIVLIVAISSTAGGHRIESF